jgi:peptide/nickel transport system substrate-binding protein
MRKGIWSRVVALLVMGMLVLSVGGIAGQGPQIPNPDTLVVLAYGEPAELDPATSYDARGWLFIQNLYDRLVQYEGEDTVTLHPMLAESWEVSADGLVYTFNLRKDATFHDGSPVTAEAVKYSFDRVIKMNQPPSWMLSQMMDLNSTKVIDDYTVEITLTKPYAAALPVFAVITASIVNPAVVEAHGGVVEGEESEWMNMNEAGSGPFKLKEWIPAERAVVERFDDYWRGRAKLAKVDVKFFPEIVTRIMLLKKGDADIATGFPETNIPDVIGAEGVILTPYPTLDISFIVLGCRGPLAEKKVRQAVSYGFPYDTVLKFVYHGYADRLTGTIPKGLFGYYEIPEEQRYSLDLDKANQLLDEAGWTWEAEPGVGYRQKDGQRLEAEILVPEGDEVRSQDSVLWQDKLRKIGFDLKVREITWPVMYQIMRNRESDMIISGWLPDYADPDNYADAMLGSANASAIWGSDYSNPTMDELIDKAKWEPDREKRAELYKQIQELSHEDAAYVWLAQTKEINVRRTWVQGYYYNATKPMDWFPMYKGRE